MIRTSERYSLISQSGEEGPKIERKMDLKREDFNKDKNETLRNNACKIITHVRTS